jgi:hypothetical protein
MIFAQTLQLSLLKNIPQQARPCPRRGCLEQSTAAGGCGKMRLLMDDLGTQYPDGIRRYNIAAIGYPTMPFPAPSLPTDGDALPSTFEVNDTNYPDTAILRNALPGPAFRAPGLSIPAGLARRLAGWI